MPASILLAAPSKASGLDGVCPLGLADPDGLAGDVPLTAGKGAALPGTLLPVATPFSDGLPDGAPLSDGMLLPGAPLDGESLLDGDPLAGALLSGDPLDGRPLAGAPVPD